MTRCRLLPVVWMLLAAALLARVLLPAGWMPAAHDGEFRIALCTSSGPAFVMLARDGSLHKDPSGQAQRDPCPYALAASHAADVPAADWPAVRLAGPDRTAPSFQAAAEIIRRTLRPPARGPPALA